MEQTITKRNNEQEQNKSGKKREQAKKIIKKPFSMAKTGVVRTSEYVGMALFNYFQYTEKFSIRFSVSRKVSQFSGLMSRIHVPKSMRQLVFGSYSKVYNVIQDDMVREFEEFNNFKEFFTRQVKPRYIDPNPNILVSPADSKILQISELKGDKNLLIKKVHYSLGEFLTGIDGYKMEGEVFDSLKLSPKKDSRIFQVIFYLNPGDYHRYHCPTDLLIKRAWHIAGFLAPVKENYIGSKPRVYETNERINCVGEYNQGFMSMVFVGATNVGSMTLNFDEEMKTNQKLDKGFQKCVVTEYDKKSFGENEIDERYEQEDRGIKVPKGEEVGTFKLGSTVVLIFEVQDDIKFLVEPGSKIRFGQPFAEIVQ